MDYEFLNPIAMGTIFPILQKGAWPWAVEIFLPMAMGFILFGIFEKPKWCMAMGIWNFHPHGRGLVCFEICFWKCYEAHGHGKWRIIFSWPVAFILWICGLGLKDPRAWEVSYTLWSFIDGLFCYSLSLGLSFAWHLAISTLVWVTHGRGF